MVTFYAAAAPQDFNALTQSYSPNQKNPAPPSWEKWDGSWKIEYNFYRNSLMCAVILYKLCPLGNMLDVAFKLNWNCPPSQSNVIVTHLLNKLCSQLCALLSVC